jgi:hypothetical protein
MWRLIRMMPSASDFEMVYGASQALERVVLGGFAP